MCAGLTSTAGLDPAVLATLRIQAGTQRQLRPIAAEQDL